ncbi:MAG: ABC transporter permease, partial [Betaproteobacteria bacterium]|nr:ABC transporter permease [Betaproteobacteria bacterium]
MAATDADRYAALSVESADVRPQETAWQRVRRNLSVRIGGVVLVLLLAVATLAPWLGTVDPTMFDAGSRDLPPGARGEMLTLNGEVIQHRFHFGSDSLGRDIYSRVIYGTRVSLFVGVVAALVSLLLGVFCGLTAGYLRWL